jgi:hypothetical protein
MNFTGRKKMVRNNRKLIYAMLMAFVFSFAFCIDVKAAPAAEKTPPAVAKPAPASEKPATTVEKSVPAAAEEETIAGTVVKTDKGIVIEAEDGEDYIVKGQDLSKMVGKMIEATGVITESDKGDVIDVKSFEEIQE